MSGPIVETSCGKIEGELWEGLNVFRGIPFAKPPVGSLRWRSPQAPEPWPGVRSAREFSPAAPQDKSPVLEVGPQSEDCLYLNVWTPACDGGKRPVMVWFHGGGFLTGSGSIESYHGTSYARRFDTVIVTANYRLGALGFGHLADLCGEEFESNCGLSDQVAALSWVCENIERFGGDASNITIFGESAGGMTVGTLLGTPAAKGLFHKAIPQSGAAHHACSREDGTRAARVLLDALGLHPGDEEKLRYVPAADIVKAQRKCLSVRLNERRLRRLPLLGMPFIPVIDGKILPKDPLEAIRGGLSKDVSVLTGTTLDEWMFFIILTDPKKQNLSPEACIASCEARNPGRGAASVELYRRLREGKLPASPADLFCAIESDRVFRIPAVRLAEAQSAHQPNTYLYLFAFSSPAFGGKLRACHAIDVPFTFGTTETAFGKFFTGGGPGPKNLADQVQRAWSAFARTGRPEAPGGTGWPAYTETTRPTMRIDTQWRLESDPLAEERRFWNEIL